MQIPTNAEIIFDEGLDNMILVEIPKTKFAILGKLEKNGRWNVSIINRIGCSKRTIGESLTKHAFNAIITRALAHPDQELFKRKLTLTKLTNHYKSLLKQSKPS